MTSSVSTDNTFAERTSGQDDEGLTLVLGPELVAALDRFIATEAPASPRPDALRNAFRQWAEERGYLAHQPPDQGKRPSELTSDNDG